MTEHQVPLKRCHTSTRLNDVTPMPSKTTNYDAANMVFRLKPGQPTYLLQPTDIVIAGRVR